MKTARFSQCLNEFLKFSWKCWEVISVWIKESDLWTQCLLQSEWGWRDLHSWYTQVGLDGLPAPWGQGRGLFHNTWSSKATSFWRMSDPISVLSDTCKTTLISINIFFLWGLDLPIPLAISQGSTVVGGMSLNRLYSGSAVPFSVLT